MGRILGVDLGTRRTGIALSDPGRRVASPLCVLAIESRRRLVAAILDLVAEHEVTAVVVGVPYSMRGGEGPAAQAALAFIDRLARHAPVPVHGWDERLTSVGAHGALREGGVSSRAARGKVDMIAAALLLQSYLDGLEGETHD